MLFSKPSAEKCSRPELILYLILWDMSFVWLLNCGWHYEYFVKALSWTSPAFSSSKSWNSAAAHSCHRQDFCPQMPPFLKATLSFWILYLYVRLPLLCWKFLSLLYLICPREQWYSLHEPANRGTFIHDKKCRKHEQLNTPWIVQRLVSIDLKVFPCLEVWTGHWLTGVIEN